MSDEVEVKVKTGDILIVHVSNEPTKYDPAGICRGYQQQFRIWIDGLLIIKGDA